MRAYLLLPALALLTGCNWVMNVSGLAAESNKAIGASCRQTGRSLEECYNRNPDADKAQIFAGWREMHEYMTKNKLETVAPPPEPVPPPPEVAETSEAPHASSADTAQKKSEPVAAAAPAAVHGAKAAPPAAAAVVPQGRRVLTNEEAEALAKNDPLIDSILSTVRGAEREDKADKGAPSAKDNRLLNILNELEADKNAPAAPAKPATPAPKPAAGN
ncbi:MAG: hypothetical protein ACK4FZ_06595 [Vogesella sp.]|uniref:hypothetical protein n=1 Tax=Vogesella sp. TaxID=1904252 RepID=UPI0039197075